MCTVTYLPLHNSEYILTHNRDEKITRGIASLPTESNIANEKVIYPTDIDALGTWISLSEKYTCCLLNGGFSKHEPKGNYRHSRGKIILDFYQHENVASFITEYNFDNLEPFTLIIIENGNKHLHEIVLHENKIHHQQKDVLKPHIWSSATLYDETDRNRRGNLFEGFIQNHSFTQENILNFHTDFFGNNEEEGFVINRENKLKTVSISSIFKSNKSSFYYRDLIQSKNIILDL